MKLSGKLLNFETFQGLAHKAIVMGAELNEDLRLTWDVSGDCETPVYREFWTQKPRHLLQTVVVIDNCRPRRFMAMYVRCRKCPHCRTRRAREWRYRAKFEILNSSRTWHCTFTVRPHERVLLRLKAGSWDYDALSAEVSKEFTKYLKRLRKNSGVRFRYLLVFEKHKDGFPHLHCLIHEVGQNLTKRRIQGTWKLGFSDCKLCDGQAANYVTKYIFKENWRRVRSSLTYGHRLCDNLAPKGQDVTHPHPDPTTQSGGLTENELDLSSVKAQLKELLTGSPF